MQCAFHAQTNAVTLCARCARALCQPCTTSSPGGRICAAGCEASPRTVNAARAASEVVAPPVFHTAAVAGTADEVTPFTRWLRSGAATFLVGSTATSTHWAALGLVGCLVSFVCLCNAWRSHRAIRLWPE